MVELTATQALVALVLSLNMLLLVLAFASVPAARRVLNMQRKWFGAVMYMIKSKDKVKAKNLPCASKTNLKDPKLKQKTLVFVRHGESVWNEVRLFRFSLFRLQRRWGAQFTNLHRVVVVVF